MEKSKIIKPQEEEYDELLEIWERSVRATHDFLAEEDILFFKPLIRNTYFYHVDLYGLKDKENDKYIGFLGVKDGKTEMLFIDPEARGKGGGKILIGYALEQCGAKEVDVNEQNRQAVGFYLHLGFRITSRDELDGMGKPYPILHLEYSKQDG